MIVHTLLLKLKITFFYILGLEIHKILLKCPLKTVTIDYSPLFSVSDSQLSDASLTIECVHVTS